MPVVVMLAAVVVAGLPWLWSARRRAGRDIPARIVAGAVGRLPACLQEWGQAMAAELPQIPDRAGRWRFAAGVLRVALFPPVRHGRRVLVTALAGLAAAAGLTAAAAGEVPSLTVFAAAFGLLLGGYATMATWRSAWDDWTARQVVVVAVATAGVAASVTDAVWVAVFHPAAITASTNVPAYSIVFAVLLAGFLVAALSLPRGRHGRAVLWWGLGGTLASGTVYVAAAVTGAVGPELLVGLVTALAIAALVSARTGSQQAGIRAGLLVAALSAPIRFAVDITTLLRVHHYTLTDSYDIAAFPHSGYPDVASYLLSDALGGAILSGMLIYSVLTIAVALLGAAVGARSSRPDLLTDG
jgi:hypothetical protein